ncbi:ABC transporter substrate-binding protein [Thalassotalea psychrophila]|uniref:histidine kinase n=1 Tax=Thalassotalea psychrophila TaxID=3065647 RepID=A0ABY9TPB2_9GAMM|nr:ABC transporter substrate-binding protein [Colwelliaceae bacterium SQ149]
MFFFQSNIPYRISIHFARLFLAVGLMLVLSIKPLAAESAPQLERVVIQLKWSHQFQFAGYYAAKEMGFYAEEGLEVVLQESDYTKSSVKHVLDGAASYGVDGSGLILHRLRGEPVVLLKQIFQHSPLVLITLKDSEISSPYNLKGKRIMLDYKDNHVPLLAMLTDTIGEIDRTKLMAPINRIASLTTGKTDAVVGYSTNQPYDFKELGVQTNEITPRNFGLDFYGDNFFTTESEIAEHPARVDAMIRATIKGWRYALDHQEEIIKLIQDKYNSKLSYAKLAFEAEKTAQLIRINDIPLGSVVPRRFSDMANIYQNAGFIDEGEWGNFIYKHESGISSIKNQFQNLSNHHGELKPVTKGLFDSKLFTIVLVFILTIACILLLFRWLNSSNSFLSKDPLASPEANRYLVVLVNGLLIVIALALTWWALDNIKLKVQQKMQDSLLVVLNTSQEALKLWSNNQKRQLKGFAINADIIAQTRQQLEKYQLEGKVKNTDEFKELKNRFLSLNQGEERHNFDIIAPDGTTIFSMHNATLGKVNLIKKQRPDLLSRALNGEVVMVPPIQSDVGLSGVPAIADNVFPATMFFVSPIVDSQNKVIAVLSERHNPHGSFSALHQLGRIGRTGETYSFNRGGKMLSDSRFDDDLKATGLLQPTEQSILSLQLRNPGGNLLAGYQPSVARNGLPLTTMAKNATAGFSSVNVEGYRDYRGVIVMGAWFWDESLDMGTAVEIDFDEAMEAYSSAQTVVLVTLIIIVVISIISSLLVMMLNSRGNRHLLEAQSQLEERVKQRTVEVKLSETRLQMVIDNVPGPVYFKDSQNHYQLINTVFEQATGFSREYVLGKTDSQLFEPEIAKKFLEEDNQVMAGGKVRRFEEQLPDANGLMCDYFTTKVPVSFMGNEGLIGVALDITERKQAELKLQQVLFELNEQRHVFDQHAMIAVTDLKGTITSANQKFADLSGYTINELIGRNHRMHNSGEHSEDFWKEMFRTIKAGGVWHKEVCNRKKSGEIYWVETTITGFKEENGKPTAYISIKTDISARKLYEEKLQRAIGHAEAANIAKSEFVASMSHEIRTPMNGVIGLLDLLSSSEMSDEQHNHVRLAQNSGQNLLNLINDILDFSKVEAGKLELEELEFDVHNLFEDIRQTLVIQTNDKGLELELNARNADLKLVKGDPSRLRQIVLNLVSNAIKFTAVGKVVIDVKLKQLDYDSLQLVCAITDTGIGIPEESLSGLFNSFIQVDASTTRKFGGSGLGLAICKNLCQLMQGDINVTSELDKGSCFEFALPLKRINSGVFSREEIRLDKADFTVKHTWPSTTRILLVEDNQVNQVVLKGMLKRMNLSCDIAGNGLEAIASLKESPDNAPYTLIFMDCQMPELDGYQTSRQIRAAVAGERYSEVPIIALTANAMSGDKNKCLRSGMNDYLSKPVKGDDVSEKLCKWLLPSQVNHSADNDHKIAFKVSDTLNPSLFLPQNLLEFCAGDKKVAQELLEIYLHHSVNDKDKLLKAYHNNDNAKVKELAHKINGSITYLAAKCLSEQAVALELHSSSKNSTLAVEIIDTFLDGLNTLDTQAKNWLNLSLTEHGTTM